MKLTDLNLDGIKIKPLDNEEKRKLNVAFDNFLYDMELVWPEYVEQMRMMKIKNYSLSLTRVIG